MEVCGSQMLADRFGLTGEVKFGWSLRDPIHFTMLATRNIWEETGLHKWSDRQKGDSQK